MLSAKRKSFFQSLRFVKASPFGMPSGPLSIEHGALGYANTKRIPHTVNAQHIAKRLYSYERVLSYYYTPKSPLYFSYRKSPTSLSGQGFHNNKETTQTGGGSLPRRTGRRRG